MSSVPPYLGVRFVGHLRKPWQILLCVERTEAVKPSTRRTEDVLHRRMLTPFLVDKTNQREKMLKTVKVLVIESADRFGITKLEDVTKDDTSSEEILKDSLAKKANASIKSRASAMILYIRWCRTV